MKKEAATTGGCSCTGSAFPESQHEITTLLWAKTPIIREVITDRNNFCSTGTMMSPLLRRGTSVGTKKPFIISSRTGSEACRSPQNTPVIKNPGSEVLKELKGWINYNPALYYPTLEQNKKLYTKLYELPHIFSFSGASLKLGRKSKRASDLYQITQNTGFKR